MLISDKYPPANAHTRTTLLALPDFILSCFARFRSLMARTMLLANRTQPRKKRKGRRETDKANGQFRPQIVPIKYQRASLPPFSASVSSTPPPPPGTPPQQQPNPSRKQTVAVLSRILFGSLDVDSYDVGPAAEAEDDGGAGDDATHGRRRRRGRRRTGLRQRHRTATASTPSFLLTPLEGNIHAFRAPTPCAVFDVLVSEEIHS